MYALHNVSLRRGRETEAPVNSRNIVKLFALFRPVSLTVRARVGGRTAALPKNA